jgi:hypothetical protein
MIANGGGLAPKLGGAIIVLDDMTVGIADTDADGKPLEESVARLQRLLQGTGDC